VRTVFSFQKNSPKSTSVSQFQRSIITVYQYRIQTHKNVFVDHLAFVKGQNGRKIVSKVWHLEK
jgi:hypothetical protein